jgi:hypothetical protein
LQDEVITVVGTYIRQANLGDSLKLKANLTKKTLMSYMKSAATLYHHYAGALLSLYISSPTGGEAKLHPFLADILQQCTARKQPKQMCEPFTMKYLMHSWKNYFININITTLSSSPKPLLSLIGWV